MHAMQTYNSPLYAQQSLDSQDMSHSLSESVHSAGTDAIRNVPSEVTLPHVAHHNLPLA